MSTNAAVESIDGAKATATPNLLASEEKELELSLKGDDGYIVEGEYRRPPTDEELHTLRRVSGKIPWQAYTIGFVELCERFSYYGTTAVFTNFIQQPLPDGYGNPSTGAGYSGQSGALGQGQRASTGLTTFNQFWSYCMPLLGAYIADQYWGRFKTIQWSICAAIIGHVILIISALPPVLKNSDGALACFVIGLIIMGVGTGGFKPNVSVLITEQYKDTTMYVMKDSKGELVIMDPEISISRIYNYFYMMINIGSLIGQIAMVYAEKYVGFYLAFLLPTVMYCFAPIVLFLCRNRYAHTKPTGSTLPKAMKLWGLALKGQWSWSFAKTRRNMTDPDFWAKVTPSRLGANKPAWMTFDDAWVYEVRRGLLACKVFLWYPIYWLAYSQMTNNLTSQSATMELHGVPNDLIQNIDPIIIILFIPIMDLWGYPALRKMGIHFTPLKRIFVGFMTAAASMVAACVIQYYIYKLGACGHYMNTCDTVAPINVWVQIVPYVLIGISEIFASITSLEYAFTKAPKNMRSMVQAVSLFMNAISSAIAEAFVSLSDDPLLVWNYGVVAVLAFVAGIGFWAQNYKLDREEDKLNSLPVGTFDGKIVDEESGSEHGAIATEEKKQEKI